MELPPLQATLHNLGVVFPRMLQPPQHSFDLFFCTLADTRMEKFKSVMSFLSTVLGRNPVPEGRVPRVDPQRPRLSPAAYKGHCTKYNTIRLDFAHFFVNPR